MNKILITLSIFLGVLTFAHAQAPKDWTRTAEKKVLMHNGSKLNYYGQWTNPDRSQAVMVTGAPRIDDLQEVRNHVAGIQSGVLQSGTYPLEYEVLREPHPGFILRGQIERNGVELFESTYVLVTENELFVLKINSTSASSKLRLADWALGDPLKKGRAEHLELMTVLVKDSNDSIEKFQEVVKGLRREQKSHTKSEQGKR